MSSSAPQITYPHEEHPPQQPYEMPIEDRLERIEAELLAIKPLLERFANLITGGEELMQEVSADIKEQGIMGLAMKMMRG